VLIVPGWSDLLVHAGRLWSRILLGTAGARVTVHGLEHATRHRPCVFIANHQSAADIWVMFNVIPPNTRFVAKQELFRIPIFGWVLAASGCVPINRSNRTEAIRSLGVAAERIRAGRSVVLFPEGTRSRDGSFRPFKKGAFHLAIQAGVPVVPVAIKGSFDVVPPGRWRVNPGPIEVYVEPPVDVTPYCPEDSSGLMDTVRETIGRRVEVPRAERDGPAVPQESS